MTRETPLVFSIPPGEPFLPTLVHALLQGNLIEGFTYNDDPLSLADVTIFVPTRRAARDLKLQFSVALGGEATILPVIRTLGDIDEDNVLEPMVAKGDLAGLDLAPAIPALERQLLLSRFIMTWSDALAQADRTLYQDEAIAVPATFTDAAWMANDLAKLMDAVAAEEADWGNLAGLVEDEYAGWWQLTLAFLKVATEQWPAILASRGATDMVARRGVLIKRQAAQYRQFGSKGPVIAAGSTGSIPATADLLNTIAHMPNGAVVLPGLDRSTGDETWDRLDQNAGDETTPGHPQFGLKKLLSVLQVSRQEVVHLVDEASQPAALNGMLEQREKIVAEALLPSFSTHNWHQHSLNTDPHLNISAVSQVTLIEAPAERQEAAAISLALRETLEQPGKTAALITPDRALARRVASELKRFGISIDDSAGRPLRELPAGVFVRLILQVAFSPPDPVIMTGLLKHPLASFGLETSLARHGARLLELSLIRGAISPPTPGQFVNALETLRIMESENPNQRQTKHIANDEDWALMQKLAGAIDATFSDMKHLVSLDRAQPLADLISMSILVCEQCAAGELPDGSNLYSSESGKALAGLFDGLLSAENTDVEIKPSEWPSLFDALMGDRVVRPNADTHPRLAIWGPLEARLQSVDRVVLGGLNEGTWPSTGNNDPFLSRPMKGQLNLELPERRIGLAAHDFQMAMGTREVVLTRAERVEHAPTVASRWLQRLTTICGDDALISMQARGKNYLAWVEQIDQRSDAANVNLVSQPNPRPPLEARPKRLSITEIETWIRDPYAIYARHILKLSPLEPLLRRADARERGTLYHAIFEDYVKNGRGPLSPQALQHLLDIAQKHFTSTQIPEDIRILWWPRFVEIATSFVAWENSRADSVVKSHIEVTAGMPVADQGFHIRGRADRIDILQNGKAAIIDYKTGSSPTVGQVRSLLAPQLPLEGALLQRGGFEDIASGAIDALIYVRLRGSNGFSADNVGGGKEVVDVDELSHEAWGQLEQLVKDYSNPLQGYLSRARPFKETSFGGDYDHLARVREWSLGDGDADE